MKLEALNRIEGVKVLAGKGEGGSTAFVGDVFEATSTKEAERLVSLGVAEEYVVKDKLAGKEPQKKSGGRKPAAKKGSEQKAEDGSDTADDSDLGLDS